MGRMFLKCFDYTTCKYVDMDEGFAECLFVLQKKKSHF